MSPYVITVRRLMHLASIVRDQAQHPQRFMTETLAGVIEDAAMAVQTVVVDEPEQLPQVALDMLQEAVDLLTDHDFRIPATIIGYTVAPVTGALPQMDQLDAVSMQLARQDADLRARRATVIEHGHLNSRDDEVLTAALTGLLVLHRSHERLAASIRVDNDRPCNRGKAPADLNAQ
ncbi:hypothetical protein OIC43_37100 [Streptomyces sp. NBC_00825]|uniref:hypothetical protein n=1 Tax=unclassified Streptomyces TaxID=2593676 RepID=UPI002ED26941|nr:hypothetical protein OG832_06590 [Streptomyces sp. NBC_00826]WTH94255.1 hypothetical protein OIC43_37100 [Streptomyces sp. NBC_00825]WTI02990.1 hypothetical protein OHA23_37080 [Streptomyces sp. NBC_00822]